MATLTVQDLLLEATADQTADAATNTGDAFENIDERVFFRAINGSGAPITVTIAAQEQCNHGFTHDVVGAVVNGEFWDFGPFDKERFNDANGLIQVTYSTEVSLTVAAIRLPVAP
jgi:hypothetical protein